MKKLVALIGVVAFLAFARAASAHVGSPDVFYEGDAGPYHLFVTVRVPQVIPGVAEVEVRAASDEVTGISTAVTWIAGPAAKNLPVPDVATRSKADPRFFTSSVWLMEYGSLRMVIGVKGAHGPAQLAIPVASFGQKTLAMPKALGALLLALTIGLALGAISIVGAAARESRLAPGIEVSPEYRRRGWRAMAIMAGLIALLFYGGLSWWNTDAAAYANLAKFFKSPKLDATLTQGNRLTIRPSDPMWVQNERIDKLLPDHGHLVHLFLVRTPGLDRIWHLHPERTDKGTFEEKLPAIEAGHYEVFADVVGQYGFPWTLVGAIDMPSVAGPAMSGDDSEGLASPLSSSSADTTTSMLSDGTQVIWNRDAGPVKANAPMILKFEVRDKSGAPATDLEPYMGMSAHAEIIRDDLSVFAHIHPTGSAPMASMMMASADPSAMPEMKMATDKVSPELSIPYGFPKPGLYRIFLQFKRAGRIETASFDTRVE